jgi:hypothetical protein
MPASRKTLMVLGNTIRVGTIVVYLAWVGVGFYILHHKAMKRVHSQYVATSDLPVGHLLRAIDFTVDSNACSTVEADGPSPSQLTGKYLLHSYKRGKPFQKSDLSVAPVTELGEKKMRYVFPLQKQLDLVEILNTGSHVDVCWKVCVLENARVLSIVGPSGQGAEYYAVLEIPAGDDAKVTGEITNYRVFLRNE